MSATQELNSLGMRDFSRSLEPVRFRINEDVFEAAPDLPAEAAFELAAVSERAQQAPDAAGKSEVFKAAFRMVLFPESARRFEERLSDIARPISAQQLAEVIQWLLERYGGRPTSPSPDSSDGSEFRDGGTTSTGGSPSLALIPTGSPSPGSST